MADLVILEKDPLIDIRFARTTLMVMKNGRLYQSSNLEEVWPRKRKNRLMVAFIRKTLTLLLLVVF